MSADVLRRAATKAKLTPAGRFWSKVGPRTESGCWIWHGTIASNGYGRFWIQGRFVQAHRWSYAAAGGLLPPSLVLDHLCRTRLCVRPDHLEPVTYRENAQRGAKGRMVTVCASGHDYTPENTYIKPNGCRDCRTCRRNRKRKGYINVR